MGRRVLPWGWAVPATNIDDVGDHLISAHIVGSMEIPGLVTRTLAGWDPELCTSEYLLRYGRALAAKLWVYFRAPTEVRDRQDFFAGFSWSSPAVFDPFLAWPVRIQAQSCAEAWVLRLWWVTVCRLKSAWGKGVMGRRFASQL